MLSLLNAQCLNININLAYKSPFAFVLVFYFLTSIASKLVDLLTCLNPHRPVQSQSRGDHSLGIRDHPCLPWLYRNSTEKRKKVQIINGMVVQNRGLNVSDIIYLQKHHCPNCSGHHYPYTSSSFDVFSFPHYSPSSFYLVQPEVMRT